MSKRRLALEKEAPAIPRGCDVGCDVIGYDVTRGVHRGGLGVFGRDVLRHAVNVGSDVTNTT